MKIALCGASGTGKTTLGRKIAAELGAVFDERDNPNGDGTKISLTRALAYEYTGIADPYLVDKHGMRTQFQKEGIERKKQWELDNSTTGFVTDRSHLDWCAYSVLHDINETGSDPDFRDRCYRYTAEYDVLVFCTMSRFFNLGGDLARKSSVLYQETYESVLLNLVTKMTVAMGGRVRLVIPSKGDSFEDIYAKVTGVRL